MNDRYVVMLCQPWKALKVFGVIDAELSNSESVGYMMVYASEEAARKEWPDAQILRATTGKETA